MPQSNRVRDTVFTPSPIRTITIMGEHDEFIADFLEECDENLDQLDQELVALEEDPRNQDRLRSIFRNIHTIKGSSGFFGFSKLGALTHEGETLLGRIRDGDLLFNREIASGLLKMADAIREILSHIEQTGGEGDRDYGQIAEQLRELLVPSQADVTQAAEAEPPSSRGEEPNVTQGVGPESGIEPGLAAAPLSEAASIAEGVSGQPEPRTDHQDGDQLPNQKPNERESLTPTGMVVDEASEAIQQPVPDGQSHVPSDPRRDDNEAEAPSPVSNGSSAKSSEASSIRVDIGLLDELMDFAGELVLARNALTQCSEATEDARLAAVSGRVSQITSEIQDRVTRTRMQPIGAIWGKFRRIVRDLSVACGKQVRLELEGEETELDRSLLEAIRDPLTHIVRNAVDHGIETPEGRQAAGKPREGLLRLRARHESGQVVIEAIDDGAGIDVERVRAKAVSRGLMTAEEAAAATPGQVLQCIFEPGFSTAKTVSAISGRGVGMDVVRSHIERIGGSVQLRSRLGEGTTLTIKIPLTLAIVPALMVASGGQRFVIPQASLLEVVTAGGSAPIEWIQDAPVFRLRQRLLPLICLDQLLGLAPPDDGLVHSQRQTFPVAVLKVEQFRYGLVIDEVLNSHEIVVKPIGASVKAIGAYSAATILGDGSVALILDVGGIAKLGRLIGDDAGRAGGYLGETGEEPQIITELEDQLLNRAEESGNAEQSLLVCQIADDRQIGLPLEMVVRLEELPHETIQQIESGTVASYRGDILPLVRLGQEKTGHLETPVVAQETVQVVVLRSDGQLIGAMVERVVDIVAVQPRSGFSKEDTGQAIAAQPDHPTATLVDGCVLEVMDPGRIKAGAF